LALSLYRSVLDELAPDKVIGRNCSVSGPTFTVGSLDYDLRSYLNVFVCGAGKASAGLAKAVMDLIGDWVTGGLVITKHGHGLALGPIEVIEAGHPVPDRTSLAAGEAMLRFANSCGKGDLVVFVLSGGASALMEAPEPDVDFLSLVEISELMLASGAPIREINQVRNLLSRIKGGKLALAFEDATVICLVLSDVKGDDFSVIGSGPLWDPPTVNSPLQTAAAYGVSGLLSKAAMERISRATPVDPRRVPHLLLDNSERIATAIEAKAKEMQIEFKRALNAHQEARLEAADLLEYEKHTPYKIPRIVYSVGETVVKLKGKGKGGRCQEFACAAADLIKDQPDIAVLAAGTDGTDGPTEYAGGLVDGDSVKRAGPVTVKEALAKNDSNRFLAACDGLITTGPTHSNVTDLYIAVRA
jgi:glycerate-2-kinase